MPDHHRHERVGEEIAHEINAMLAGELKDPRLEGNVCVSEVRVQPDMKTPRNSPMPSRLWSTLPVTSGTN
jgi:ribosome-binding factor A